ncbi:hypothetical protein, partial [Duncaniella muricolitica]|uniref:hypothetical protein n=1 Tax=Duncaniella muricolitica TaxID=2880704 RepID=UPI00244E106D
LFIYPPNFHTYFNTYLTLILRLVFDNILHIFEYQFNTPNAPAHAFSAIFLGIRFACRHFIVTPYSGCSR